MDASLVVELLELLLQDRAQVLMLLWQLQRLAQMSSILVAVEARLVGGDFEQYTTRRAEIDRPEIVAVDYRRDVITRVHQRLAHFELLFAVVDGKGDVMNGTCALQATLDVRHGFKVDQAGAIAARNDQAGYAILGFERFIAHVLQE